MTGAVPIPSLGEWELNPKFRRGLKNMSIEKPSSKDQIALKREYKKLCLGVPFDELQLPDWQKETLKAYTAAASEGKHGAQIATDLGGWSTCFCCDLRSIRKRAREELKTLKMRNSYTSKMNFIEKNKEMQPYLKAIGPVNISIVDAFKLRVKGLNTHELQLRGVTSTQLRKMKKFKNCLIGGSGTEMIVATCGVTSSEVRAMKKIALEAGDKKNKIIV
jgi:hypothetical protein